MGQQKIFQKRRRIMIVAIIASVFLYMAGVFSGIYANKLVKEETKQDIMVLKRETKQDLGHLQKYISFLDTNLKDIQLEQTFAETLSAEQMCNFSSISMNELVNQLRYYWDKLPYRLEEYERNNQVSDEYLLLKEQYAHLSIRTWILAKSQFDRCNMSVVHGLYFYSAECSICVKQGEQIDRLKQMVSANAGNLIMFPIDFNSTQAIVKNLKNYYGLKSTPAIVINDRVFQGRLFKAEELINNSKRQIRNA
ncbi:hypothetical protein HYY70_01935 [Candidatus Woesearchaeota archaeon]|nr:hypothetical protein [Candidatus Woesearchaeota archaeon]